MREFSIPMPIPIPTRASKTSLVGGNGVSPVVDGGLFGAKAVACHGDRVVVVMASVQVGRLRRMGTASFCDFL